jgi:Protein of unknown function (DUF3320)
VLRSVIPKEGPIHRDEIVRRIGHFFGKRGPSPRIVASVKRALDLLPDAAQDVCHEAGFWFTQEQKNLPIVRDRSVALVSLRNHDFHDRDKRRDFDGPPAKRLSERS